MLNLYNQLSWRIIANNTIFDAKESRWITDEYYSESIRNVIGEAIADCVTERNEFAGKSETDVMSFAVEATSYTARDCSPFHERPYLYARSSLTERVNMIIELL